MFKLADFDTTNIDSQTKKLLDELHAIININKKDIYDQYENHEINSEELIKKLDVLKNDNKTLTEIINKLIRYQLKHCKFYKSKFIFNNLNDFEKIDKISKNKILYNNIK